MDGNITTQLLNQHKYEEAAAIFESQIVQSGIVSVHVTEFVIVMLCLGKFERALELIELSDHEPKFHEVPGGGGAMSDFKAIAYWSMNRRDKAMQVLKATIEGVLDRSIRYADPAGGCDWGLMLWYMSCTDAQSDGTSFSLKYLKNRARRSAFKIWPGPVASYVLGKMSDVELLNDHFQSADVDHLVATTKSDAVARSRLIQALFYVAEKCRQFDDEAKRIKLLRIIADAENTHYMPEWYYARQSLGLGYN